MAIARAQHPVAVLVSCSDSRVPPEVLFGKGLEFLARGHPPAWLLLSKLEQDAGGRIDSAAECVRRYLESKPGPAEAGVAWQRLVFLYRATGDVLGGCDAFLKAAESTEPPLNE